MRIACTKHQKVLSCLLLAIFGYQFRVLWEDLFVTSVSASCAHNNTTIRRWTTLVADVRQINEPFYLIFSDQTYRSYTSCFLTKESRKALLLLMHVSSLFFINFFSILIMTCDSTKRDINICMKTIFDGSCHFQKNNTEMFFLEHHISCMRGVFHYFLFSFNQKICSANESLRYSLEGIHAVIDERRTSLRIKLGELECGNTGMSRHEDRREPICVVSVYVSSAQKLYSTYLTRTLFSQHRVKIFWIKWILPTSWLLKATKGRCYLEIYLLLSSIFIRRYFLCFACCR